MCNGNARHDGWRGAVKLYPRQMIVNHDETIFSRTNQRRNRRRAGTRGWWWWDQLRLLVRLPDSLGPACLSRLAVVLQGCSQPQKTCMVATRAPPSQPACQQHYLTQKIHSIINNFLINSASDRIFLLPDKECSWQDQTQRLQ